MPRAVQVLGRLAAPVSRRCLDRSRPAAVAGYRAGLVEGIDEPRVAPVRNIHRMPVDEGDVVDPDEREDRPQVLLMDLD
jgi:hypothetical protein